MISKLLLCGCCHARSFKAAGNAGTRCMVFGFISDELADRNSVAAHRVV